MPELEVTLTVWHNAKLEPVPDGYYLAVIDGRVIPVFALRGKITNLKNPAKAVKAVAFWAELPEGPRNE